MRSSNEKDGQNDSLDYKKQMVKMGGNVGFGSNGLQRLLANIVANCKGENVACG